MTTAAPATVPVLAGRPMRTLLVTSLVVALSLGAQELPPSAETLQVNLVEIPVNVVDRSGNPVRGLGPDNFEVLEDGQRRKISHFEEIDLASIAVSDPQISTAAARRNFLIVFDLTHSSPGALLRARDAARDFLDLLAPHDLASVGSFSAEEGFRIVTAFTTDRHHLHAAVRALGSSRFYQTFDPLLLDSTPDLGMAESIPVSNDQTVGQEIAELQLWVRDQNRAWNDNVRRMRIERQVEDLTDLARLLDSVRGRKQIVLLSEGFDERLIQGGDHGTKRDMEIQREALLRGALWRADSDQRFGNPRSLRALEEMGRAFRRSDVVLHTIDIQGLRAPNDPRAGSQRTSSDSLFLLSRPTGGEVFNNTNDLAEAFARLLKQQEVVYILGFQARPSGQPGKFHDLKVRVRVVGYSGLRVSHRAGYYEPRVQVSAVEQRLSATDILMNDIPFEDIRTHVLATPFARGKGAEVPVIVEIAGRDLLERVPGEALNGELFIYAFDDQGSVKDYLFQIFSLDLREVRKLLTNTGLKYYGILSLPAGDYNIKTLVRVLESGSNGFTRTRISVNGAGSAAVLPPLLFDDPSRWILLRGVSRAGGDLPYPFTVGEESFIPSVHPELAAGETYKLALFTYNLPDEELEIRARLDGEGRTQSPALEVVGRTSRAPDGSMKVLLAFTPRGVAAGDYSLHVTVKDHEVAVPLRIVER